MTSPHVSGRRDKGNDVSVLGGPPCTVDRGTWRKARLAVAGRYADDPELGRELLDMLGLLDERLVNYGERTEAVGS